MAFLPVYGDATVSARDTIGLIGASTAVLGCHSQVQVNHPSVQQAQAEEHQAQMLIRQGTPQSRCQAIAPLERSATLARAAARRGWWAPQIPFPPVLVWQGWRG